MPVPTPSQFAQMLDRAQAGDYALASINVTSTSTLNAALRAFAESGSDGIVQISTGGGEFLSGPAKDMATGAIAIADYARAVMADVPVFVALTTDHCVDGKLDKFVRPIVAESKRRVEAGGQPVFNGHMYDGSEVTVAENLVRSKELLELMAPLGIVLECESGVVGGEEDGIDHSDAPSEKLYTTPEDMLAFYEALHPIGRFTLAATFGNVHGVYKPGNVTLRPEILREGNEAVVSKYGASEKLNLVFHGGSGSELSAIHDSLRYGVVKMNVDTDCQYHYTRPVADHVMKNYDGILRIDGEMGDKKAYDPRAYMKAAEKGMGERVKQAAAELKSLGITLFGQI